MRADGTQKRQLTVHPGNGFDLSPSWSPDGQRIVFQRGGISIVTVATGQVTTLDLPGTSIQPTWSPDGRHEHASPHDQSLWGGGASPTWITR